jgi:hypothetical protein
MEWCILIIPALGKLRQFKASLEDLKFKASLGYRGSTCLRTN